MGLRSRSYVHIISTSNFHRQARYFIASRRSRTIRVLTRFVWICKLRSQNWKTLLTQTSGRGFGTAGDGSANHRGLRTTPGKETESTQDPNAKLPGNGHRAGIAFEPEHSTVVVWGSAWIYTGSERCRLVKVKSPLFAEFAPILELTIFKKALQRLPYRICKRSVRRLDRLSIGMTGYESIYRKNNRKRLTIESPRIYRNQIPPPLGNFPCLRSSANIQPRTQHFDLQTTQTGIPQTCASIPQSFVVCLPPYRIILSVSVSIE